MGEPAALEICFLALVWEWVVADRRDGSERQVSVQKGSGPRETPRSQVREPRRGKVLPVLQQAEFQSRPFSVSFPFFKHFPKPPSASDSPVGSHSATL
jgi:hypothetical protein